MLGSYGELGNESSGKDITWSVVTGEDPNSCRHAVNELHDAMKVPEEAE